MNQTFYYLRDIGDVELLKGLYDDQTSAISASKTAAEKYNKTILVCNDSGQLIHAEPKPKKA